MKHSGHLHGFIFWRIYYYYTSFVTVITSDFLKYFILRKCLILLDLASTKAKLAKTRFRDLSSQYTDYQRSTIKALGTKIPFWHFCLHLKNRKVFSMVNMVSLTSLFISFYSCIATIHSFEKYFFSNLQNQGNFN